MRFHYHLRFINCHHCPHEMRLRCSELTGLHENIFSMFNIAAISIKTTSITHAGFPKLPLSHLIHPHKKILSSFSFKVIFLSLTGWLRRPLRWFSLLSEIVEFRNGQENTLIKSCDTLKIPQILTQFFYRHPSTPTRPDEYFPSLLAALLLIP